MAVTYRSRGPSTIAGEMRGATVAANRRAQQQAIAIQDAQERMAEGGSRGAMTGSLLANVGAQMLGISNPLIAGLLAGVGSGIGKKRGGGRHARKADKIAKRMQRGMGPGTQEARIKGRELHGSVKELKDAAIMSGLTSAGTTFALRGGGEYLTGGGEGPYKDMGNVLERAKASIGRFKGTKPFKTGWGIWKSPTTGKWTGAFPGPAPKGTTGGFWDQIGKEFWGAAKRGRDIPSLIDYWQGKDLTSLTIPALLTASKKGTQ
jgi:hypothetical protein